MGANGAGKSTLVKILTGAIRPTAGRILIRGAPSDIHSPAEARRAGLVSVYQEPALIPDLDVAANLRLTDTPVEPFRNWVRELGVPDLDLYETARNIPLAVLRVLDLARALAIEPDLLLLDEMTAALPANLAERVLDVVRKQTESGRSVIFISHRLLEISALCDRATVLRDGHTVGVVDMAPGAEEKIVELMLGDKIAKAEHIRAAELGKDATPAPTEAPRLRARNLRVGTKLHDVSFDLRPGEVLGLVALEGQGQDELFGVLSGSIRPSAGDDRGRRQRHPLQPPRRRDRRRRRARPRRPHRGPLHAALGPREHRAARSARGSATGARSSGGWRRAASTRRSGGSRSTPAPRPRSSASPAATSRR